MSVELNAYLYRVEQLLAHYFALLGDDDNAQLFEWAVAARLRVLMQFLWDGDSHIWRDWHLAEHRFVQGASSSNYFPL